MTATVVEALTYDVRVIAMREAIDQVETAVNVMRIATHRLVSTDLQGAVDVASHALYQLHKTHDTLERQFHDLLNLEAGPLPKIHSGPGIPRSAVTTSSPAPRGRRRGVEVIPGSIRQARLEAGLSLDQVAAGHVTRVAIWYAEKGKNKPSIETLLVIAERTGKPLEYFLLGPA